MQYDDVTTNSIWRTAVILQLFFAIAQPPIIRFNEIWQADTNFDFKNGHMRKNRKFSKYKMGTDAILKIVFRLDLGTILSN